MEVMQLHQVAAARSVMQPAVGSQVSHVLALMSRWPCQCKGAPKQLTVADREQSLHV